MAVSATIPPNGVQELVAFAAPDGSLTEFRLPAGLMELRGDLSDIITLDTWSNMSDTEKTQLRALLPSGSAGFQDDCVQQLLSRAPLLFGSPLTSFEKGLCDGEYCASAVRLRQESRAAAQRVHRLGLVDYTHSLLYRAALARRSLLPPSASTPQALAEMGVDEELLFPSMTDNESSLSEEDAAATMMMPASAEVASAMTSPPPAAASQPIARAPRPLAPLGGYGARPAPRIDVPVLPGASGTYGGSIVSTAPVGSDEEDARKKKPKTGMKREEKMAAQTLENPFRLFALIHKSLRTPAPLEKLLDEIQRSSQARPGIWLPGYTQKQFLHLALSYLANPPALPVPIPVVGKELTAEETAALQQAAAKGDVTAPFVRQRPDAKWEWVREGASIFLPPLEQIYYFSTARHQVDMASFQLQVPNLKQFKSSVTIQPTTADEQNRFRAQEFRRFSTPEQVFRYVFQNATTVVAPMRRAATASAVHPLSCKFKSRLHVIVHCCDSEIARPHFTAGTRARDHPILLSDRPAHISLLAIVRDAAARLPGGVGTRHDVAVLMRDSQYVVPDASDASINQCVSGALDRLHSERDPPVRYDGDQKLWLYLHRIREDAEFPPEPESRYTKHYC